MYDEHIMTWQISSLSSMKMVISMNDFTVEARFWLTIIYSRVSLCTHMTGVTGLRARMVSCILSGITLDVGKNFDFIVEALQESGGYTSFFSFTYYLAR